MRGRFARHLGLMAESREAHIDPTADGTRGSTTARVSGGPHVLSDWGFRRFLLGVLSWGSAHQLSLLSNSFLVYDLTGSGIWIAYLGAAQAVPQFTMAAVGGVLSDRFPRKVLLALGSTLAGLLMVTLALLSFTDQLQAWHIVLAGLGFGAALGSDWTNRLSFIPNIVGRGQLAQAVAFDQSVFQTARVLGPLVGGLVLVHFGGKGTYTIAAVLFAVSTTVMLSMRPTGAERKSHHPPIWDSIGEVAAMLRADPVVRSVLLFTAANALLVGGFTWLAPVFATKVIHGGADVQGFILTATGFGAALGAVWIGLRARVGRAGWWLLGMNGLMVAALAGYSLSTMVVLSILLAGLGGLFHAVHITMGTLTIQTRVEDDMRGRVFGVYEMAWGFFPLGGVALGTLSDLLGPVWTLLAAVLFVGLVTIGVTGLSRRTRDLRFDTE